MMLVVRIFAAEVGGKRDGYSQEPDDKDKEIPKYAQNQQEQEVDTDVCPNG
jgi:hypothetical protein